MVERHIRGRVRAATAGSRAAAAFFVLLLIACSAAAPPIGTPGQSESEPPVAAGPSRADLINRAIADGTLDPVTGLLYRAYGLFGLSGLPDEYAAGIPRADDALFGEIVEMIPSLSADDQAKLGPFVVRPTDPDSIFAAAPAAIAGLGPVAQAPQPTSATCRDWANSGEADTRFKIWACRDRDAAAADADMATIAAMLGEIWPAMTKPEPDGMGPPLPDGYGANVSAEYGGDARIDFYALNLGQIIYRDGNNSIPQTAAAAAVPSPPYTNQDGSSRRTSSGFVLVNRSRLNEPLKMKQDVVHEFFHVLQHAHNRRAPFQGTSSQWFSEASAVWAETFYVADSDEPHKWFPTHFQSKAVGLEETEAQHDYGDYIWPFFMEQEKGPSAVFQAWAAIEPLENGDFAGMTEAISSQLSFDTSFRVFAIRNLNINEVLQSAGLKRYKEQDDYFYNDKPPTSIATGTIVPGSPYLSAQQSIPALAATYFKLGVAETSREVTISLAQYSPGNQVDGDAIVHVGGRWEHRPIVGGRLKFCRDDPPDDIDSLHVVVSNHGRPGPVSGFLEASAKDSCKQDNLELSGTIVGHYDNQRFEAWDARVVADVSMSVHLTLSPSQALVDGTFTISGEVTGDCEYSESGSGTIQWDSNDPRGPTAGSDPYGLVSISMADPRYMFPNLNTLVLFSGAGINRPGGTCGHTNGPVFDASPAFTVVAIPNCTSVEIQRDDSGSWQGDCSYDQAGAISTVTVRLSESPASTPTP